MKIIRILNNWWNVSKEMEKELTENDSDNDFYVQDEFVENAG